MNKNTIDDISEIIQEKLDDIYNTAIAMANLSLLRHYKDDVNTWKKRQIKEIPQLKQEVATLIRREIKPLYVAIERAVLLSYKVADGTFNDIDINEKKIEVRANKMAEKQINALKLNVSKTLNKLPNSIGKAQLGNINQIVNKMPKSMKDTKAIDTLYQGIVKQTQQGMPLKISYKDGKQMGFREYMDMNVRTTFQKQAGDFQLQAGKDAGIIFYLCSYHDSCANDHVDFQGKIYVDEDWGSIVNHDLFDKVEDYISQHKIETIQSVRDGSPWLTTRPNCRHYFLPMNTEEVLGTSVKQMLKDNDMEKGTYDKQNYIDLQKQRYNERQIRQYKNRLEQNEIAYKNTPVEQRGALEKAINNDKALIRKWQSTQRELINSNKTLDREYDRENPKILVNDLGYRYDVKYYK